MNATRMERERYEMLNIQKKLDIDQMESAMDAKRNEIAEKRAEELVDTYLRNKQMRVRNIGYVYKTKLKNARFK
jgi:uncharacterized pyridoxal phosphate-containing UPF0001 family protein